MNRVVALVNPTGNQLLKLMRQIMLEDEYAVVFTDHARDQMEERNVNNTQVYNCLEKGILSEPAFFNNAKGNWKLTISHTTAGQEIQVAVGLSLEERVIIITVMG